jgi:hypothetical protein
MFGLRIRMGGGVNNMGCILVGIAGLFLDPGLYLCQISLLHPTVQYNLTHERVIEQVAHNTFEDTKNVPSLFIFPGSLSG